MSAPLYLLNRATVHLNVFHNRSAARATSVMIMVRHLEQRAILQLQKHSIELKHKHYFSTICDMLITICQLQTNITRTDVFITIKEIFIINLDIKI